MARHVGLDVIVIDQRIVNVEKKGRLIRCHPNSPAGVRDPAPAG
jgi:hypothetical protein